MQMQAVQAAEWTCGHVGNAMCAECYRQLAMKAGMLAEEGRLHRCEIIELREEVLVRQQRAHVLAEQVIELGEENTELRDRLKVAEHDREEAWAKIDQLLGRTP